MNWDAVGAIGEVIGAIAVVVTLVYLAYQIRQNTIQLEQNTVTSRATAQTASNFALRETRRSIYESTDMAEVFQRGNGNPDQLDDVSKLRYRCLMQNITEVMLEIYSQTLITGFSPETWNTQGITLVERVMATPGGEWFWANFAHNYPESFRTEVDRLLNHS
jgi:heme/copper-type cytochrome/quinol oxidase subunit 1